MNRCLVESIVSGGQTGADRAALDWAAAHGVVHAGWCPFGRRAEDGRIDSRYTLRETPSADYIVRTEWNVRDSDGTVIFSIAAKLTGGSLATHEIARRLGRPVLHLARANAGEPAEALRRFVEENRILSLNVAGSRASGEPEVAAFGQSVLSEAFLGGPLDRAPADGVGSESP